MFTIRMAQPDDAQIIAALRTSVWPDETVNAAYMAEVIQSPDHITLLAFNSNTPAGFVDAFLTLGPDGARRWEIDLLVVHPRFQGNGLGKTLALESTNAGPDFGAQFARALIKVDNTASQRTFATCGYQRATSPSVLMVSSGGKREVIQPGADAHLIPIATLGYRGLWIEGALNARAFNAASAICGQHQWDLAGAVVPADNAAALECATQAGYRPVGSYRWWHFTY